jgi:S-(hydroxymethyl)glutathione dehydrogenase/alcohol dehydrogenase
MSAKVADVEAWAAVVPSTGSALIVEPVTVRPPQSHEVLVEMKASGLCHTDLSLIRDDFPGPGYPAVFGHEGAGVVLECGTDVDGVVPGDRVILTNTPHCGECASCRTGRTAFCLESLTTARTVPYTWRGADLPSAGVVASFATHSVLPAGQLVKIGPDIPFEVAALVPCGVVTGVGAALTTAKVTEGATAVVIGLGSIGLNVIQGARLAKASRIVAVDTNPAKEDVARRLGATDFVDPRAGRGSLSEEVTALLGAPADYAFECAGRPQLLAEAISSVNPFWGVCVAAGIAPRSEQLTLPATAFWMGRTLLGTLLGNMNPLVDIPRILDWYRSGDLLLDELVTTRLDHADINTGFDLMAGSQVIRSVVMY